jgi:hypothetical protein
MNPEDLNSNVIVHGPVFPEPVKITLISLAENET